MLKRSCTVLTGSVLRVGQTSALIELTGEARNHIGLDRVWIPLKCIEGGSSLVPGDTDPAISNWWIRRHFKERLNRVIYQQRPASYAAR